MIRFILLCVIVTPLQAQVWEHSFYSEVAQKSYFIQTDTPKQQVSINRTLILPFRAFQGGILSLKSVAQIDSFRVANDHLLLWNQGKPMSIPLDVWENVQVAVMQEELKTLPQSVGASVDNKGLSGFFNLSYLFTGLVILIFIMLGLIFYVFKIKKQKRKAEERKSEMEMMRNHLLKDFEVKTKVILADIHDGPLQNLARFSRQLSEIQGHQTDFKSQLLHAKSEIEQVSQELRNISANITPSELSDIGLDSAMRSLLRKFKQQNPQITIEQRLDKEGLSLPENTRLMVYRIFQEALNNIEKHAKATQIKVDLSFENGLFLQIEDNGVGFLPQKVKTLENGNHLGLWGIRSRCEEMQATLNIDSEVGKGTVLRVTKGMMA